MVPAPQAALLVTEIVAESGQNCQIVAEMLARAVEVIRRDAFWDVQMSGATCRQRQDLTS